MSENETSIGMTIAQNVVIIIGTLVVLNVATAVWNKARTFKK
jgi:hypothetical protein